MRRILSNIAHRLAAGNLNKAEKAEDPAARVLFSRRFDYWLRVECWLDGLAEFPGASRSPLHLRGEDR